MTSRVGAAEGVAVGATVGAGDGPGDGAGDGAGEGGTVGVGVGAKLEVGALEIGTVRLMAARHAFLVDCFFHVRKLRGHLCFYHTVWVLLELLPPICFAFFRC